MPADGDLSCRRFDEVTFLPCVRDGRGRYGYSFGANGPDGAPIEAFAHDWCAFRASAAPAPLQAGPVIYGGVLMNHFGHFLLEAMSRLWFLREREALPILWHWIDLPVPHSPWPGWIEELWRLLGLAARRHHVIRAPLRRTEVLLPDSGLLAADRLHARQAAALACVADADVPCGDRIWLSRSALPSQFGRIEGEPALETLLASQGWSVLRPETLSCAVQATLFAAADVVAGFAGSAFHAALLPRRARARLVIVERPSVGRQHYEATARARGLDLCYLSAELEALGPLHAWTTFRLRDPSALAAQIGAAVGRA